MDLSVTEAICTCDNTARPHPECPAHNPFSSKARLTIRLFGSATHCLDCNSIAAMHRAGCRCLDLNQKDALDKINVEHGFFKETKNTELGLDDFVSAADIAGHVKNDTADVYIRGKIVTPEMIG